MGWLWKTCIVIWTCHKDGYRIQILEPTKHVTSLTLSRPRQATGVTPDFLWSTGRKFLVCVWRVPYIRGRKISELDGYHICMIPAGSGYHKTIYKRVWFSLFFFPLQFICRTRVLIFFWKINQFSICWFSICQFSKFWKHSVPLCRFSQTGYYLLIGFLIPEN
jgi:hypothetical protein